MKGLKIPPLDEPDASADSLFLLPPLPPPFPPDVELEFPDLDLFPEAVALLFWNFFLLDTASEAAEEFDVAGEWFATEDIIIETYFPWLCQQGGRNGISSAKANICKK